MMKPNYAKWRDQDLWTLLESAAILAGFEPVNGAVGPNQVVPKIKSKVLLVNFETIYRNLKNATDLYKSDNNHPRSLKFVTRIPGIGNRRVEPVACIAWARKKGLRVPTELDDLEKQMPAQQDKPLKQREKQSLLKLVIGMAVEGYRYNASLERSPIPKEIAEDLEKHGIPLDEDTVRKWLHEAAQYLPPKQGKP